MKRLILTILAILLITSFAYSEDIVSWVRIQTDNTTEFNRLVYDTSLDVASYKPGKSVDLIISQSELDVLAAEGFGYEYLTYDISNPIHTKGKGYSGYTTYDELVVRLNALVTNYPSIVSLTDLGTGRQNTHNIWMLKISDDVATDDVDEPDLLLTGIHHAREPMSLEVTLHFAEQICADYGTVTETTEYVDSLEIYIIPCLNPEGYNYDDVTVANPKKYWRKNSYDWPDPDAPDDWGNAQGTGVDLNRNYSYHWGNDSDWYEAIYCGTEAFSEPEADAIADLCDAHTASDNSFISAFHYHSYGQIFLRPYSWNHSDPPSADLEIFDDIYECYADAVDDFSGVDFDYDPGSSIGSAYDYMYAEHGTYAYTVELNSYSEGFYPDDSVIAPTCARNYEGLKSWCSYIVDNYTGTGNENGDPASPTVFVMTSAAPNPASDKVTFAFTLPETANVNLEIYDISGRKVMTVLNSEFAAGEHKETSDISALSSGIYLYQARTDELSITKKLIIK